MIDCKKLGAVFVVAIMLLSSMIVLTNQSVSAADNQVQASESGTSDSTVVDSNGSKTSLSDTDELFTYDEENDIYIMTTKGLEVFGLSSDPSTSELIANGLISAQMEIGIQSSEYSEVIYYGYGDDGSGCTFLRSQKFDYSDLLKSTLYVGFSAGLTRVATDEVSNENLYQKDWDCRLCYGVKDAQGILPMYLTVRSTLQEPTTPVQIILNITDVVKMYGGDVFCRYLSEKTIKDDCNMKTINCSDILQHAEGDFDGDGNIEIAIAYSNVLVVLKMVVDENGCRFKLFNEISDFTNGWYQSSGMTKPMAVSMSVGDLDGDLRDELVIASQTTTEYDLNATRLCVYDVNGEKNGETKGSFDQVATSIIELKDSGNTYWTCATSVDVGDVDCDGAQEIVVGGYVANWTKDNVHNNAYREGELYIAYMDYSFNSSMGVGKISESKAVTFLCEEDGTAYNMTKCTTKDTSACEGKIDGQPEKLNAYQRYSPCYVNSTIPLKTVSFYSGSNGYYDSIFFYTGLYSIMGSSTFTCNNPLLLNENRYCAMLGIMDIEACKISSNSQSPYEELAIAYRCMSCGNSPNTYMCMQVNVYTPTGDDTIDVKTPMFKDYHDVKIFDWSLPNSEKFESWYFTNCDDDATIGVKFGQLYMYTDLAVLAMISAMPIEDDLANMYVNLQNSIGNVTINSTTGTTETQETETGHEVEGYLGLDGDYIVQIHDGQKKGCLTGTEHMFESKYQVTASTDTVVMYVAPVDIYLYLVTYKGDDGKLTQKIEAIPVFHNSKTMAFSYEGYKEVVENYNATMKELLTRAGGGYSAVPIIGLDHTAGDTTTYPHSGQSTAYQYHTDFEYLTDTKGRGTYEEKMINTTTEEYSGLTTEHCINLDLGMSIGTIMYKFKKEVEIGHFDNTTNITGTISGKGFIVHYATTEPNDLKTNAPEGNFAYYSVGGICYAATKEYTVCEYDKDGVKTGETKISYVDVGFDLTSNKHPARMGDATLLTENDNKEFAMYPDSFCLKLYVPSNGHDTTEQKTLYYEVQIYLNGQWCTVTNEFLLSHGLTMKQRSNSSWVDVTSCQFVPSSTYDHSVTLLIEGFSESQVKGTEIRPLVTYQHKDETAPVAETISLPYLDSEVKLYSSEVVSLFKEKDDTKRIDVSYKRWAPGNMFTKEGFTQNGWVDQSGNVYLPGQSLQGARILYANWVPIP